MIDKNKQASENAWTGLRLLASMIAQSIRDIEIRLIQADQIEQQLENIKSKKGVKPCPKQ